MERYREPRQAFQCDARVSDGGVVPVFAGISDAANLPALSGCAGWIPGIRYSR